MATEKNRRRRALAAVLGILMCVPGTLQARAASETRELIPVGHTVGIKLFSDGVVVVGLEEVETAANLVQEAAHPDANIIFGAAFDESLEDEIRVTVIATGFEEPAAAQPAPAPTPEAPKPETPKAPEAPEAPKPEEPKGPEAPEGPAAPEVNQPPVSDSDWDILESIFRKRR